MNPAVLAGKDGTVLVGVAPVELLRTPEDLASGSVGITLMSTGPTLRLLWTDRQGSGYAVTRSASARLTSLNDFVGWGPQLPAGASLWVVSDTAATEIDVSASWRRFDEGPEL